MTLILRNSLYFLKRKFFYMIGKRKLWKNSIYLQKLNVLVIQEKELSYISENWNPNKLLIFQKKLFRLKKKAKRPTFKNFLIFCEMEQKFLKKFLIFKEETYNSWKSNVFYITFQTWPEKENVPYTFPYKEAKFSKLKFFLIIIMKLFSPFYNIFFSIQPVSFFYLPKNFCNVHDHIAAFLSLL